MKNDLERYQLQRMHAAITARNGKKIKLRWHSPTAVRRSLAAVNNLLLNGEITAATANAVYYASNVILRALELEYTQGKFVENGEKSLH